MSDPVLRWVRIKNFRSIAKCQVELDRVTLLVGRNGAGKSNFLDAIRFVRDSLDTSLDHALRDRGGKEAVLRKSQGHPNNLAVELSLSLPGGCVADYGFEISARRDGYGFEVVRERLTGNTASGQSFGFKINRGKVISSTENGFPQVSTDALALVRASSIPRFADVFQSVLAMGFYNLNPAAMKDVQDPDAGEILRPDGSNIASVIGRIKPENLTRITAYLEPSHYPQVG